MSLLTYKNAFAHAAKAYITQLLHFRKDLFFKIN